MSAPRETRLVVYRVSRSVLAALCWLAVASSLRAERISELTHHFNDSDATLTPWDFLPRSNIDLCSLRKTPGALTIRLAGRIQDVKGLLPKPVAIGEYPAPWYFRLGIVQDQNAIAGHIGTRPTWARTFARVRPHRAVGRTVQP